MSEPTIGQLVREARTRAGLTQRALAERIGVKAPYINDIEHGARCDTIAAGTVRTLARIAAVTGDTTLRPALRAMLDAAWDEAHGIDG